MLTLHIDGVEVPLLLTSTVKGESYVRVSAAQNSARVMRALITCNFQNNDDLIDLILVTDAVRRRYTVDGRQPTVALSLPRVPYGGRDRISMEGEPLSLKIIANLINAQRYQAVFCAEDESPTALALLNNVTHVGADSYIAKPRSNQLAPA